MAKAACKGHQPNENFYAAFVAIYVTVFTRLLVRACTMVPGAVEAKAAAHDPLCQKHLIRDSQPQNAIRYRLLTTALNVN